MSRSIRKRTTGPETTAHGFTLLEVMIALAIMATAIAGLLYTLNYHLDIASRHEARTFTMLLAAQKLAETRETPVPSEGAFEDPYKDYSYKVELGDSAFKNYGVGSITVTVQGNGERTVLKELFRRERNIPPAQETTEQGSTEHEKGSDGNSAATEGGKQENNGDKDK